MINLKVFIPLLLSIYFQISVAKTKEVNETTCGIRKINRFPKIVNGQSAYHGQYPWAVSIRLHRRHHCGGALLNRDWILTAAHCVSNTNHKSFTIKLGGHYRNFEIESSAIEVPVKMLIPHELFTFSSFANDIALIKLARSVNYTSYIAPICLPNDNETNYADSNATVIGWGKLTPSGSSATTLQELELPIIDNDKCMQWYQNQGKSIPIRPSQFCAGIEEGGKDACQGDSGSPMMKIDPTTGQTRVIGIVSAGIGCALPKLPGLYTRVSAYIPWISQFLNVVVLDKVSHASDLKPYSNITTTSFNPTVSYVQSTKVTNPVTSPSSIRFNTSTFVSFG